MASEKQSPLSQASRRGFLGLIGGGTAFIASQSMLPHMPSMLMEEEMALDATIEPFAEWVEHLFETDGTLAEATSLLNTLKTAGSSALSASKRTALAQTIVRRVPNEAEMLQGMYEHAYAALDHPPSLNEILKLLDSGAFQDSSVYRCFLSQIPKSDAAYYLNNLARTEPEQLHQLVQRVFTRHDRVLDELTKLARNDPALQNDIQKQEQLFHEEQLAEQQASEPPRSFSDMAASRKVAMYPIPASVSEAEQKQLGIGRHARPYVSSCEHYGTIASRDAQFRAHFENKPIR